MLHQSLLVIHLLAATIWVGGHCMLTFSILPEALKRKKPMLILHFEKRYERIGIPALLVQVITGIGLAYAYGVTVSQWFAFAGGIETLISLKLLLLFSTAGLAIHARFFIIPQLQKKNLTALAWHIRLVTALAISMLLLGSLVRKGGF